MQIYCHFQRGEGFLCLEEKMNAPVENSLKLKDVRLDHALKYYADMYLVNSTQDTVCTRTTGDLTMQTIMRLRAAFSQKLVTLQWRKCNIN